jgi:hypothetical protein
MSKASGHFPLISISISILAHQKLESNGNTLDDQDVMDGTPIGEDESLPFGCRSNIGQGCIVR